MDSKKESEKPEFQDRALFLKEMYKYGGTRPAPTPEEWEETTRTAIEKVVEKRRVLEEERLRREAAESSEAP